MRVKQALMVAGSAAALIMASATGALANSNADAGHGNGNVDFHSYGDSFNALDTDCDNHGIYAMYSVNGGSWHKTSTSTSGCHGARQKLSSPNLPENKPIRYKACATSEGCGSVRSDYTS